MIINKRVYRQMVNDKYKNLLFIILIAISIAIFISFTVGTNSVLFSLDKFNQSHNVEDGQFILNGEFKPKGILRNSGVEVEKTEFVDYEMRDEVTIRIFKEKQVLNKHQVTRGRELRDQFDILVDDNFLEANNLEIEQSISINHQDYKIVGVAISPDYICTKKNSDILQANPSSFGVAYIKESSFKSMSDKRYYYSYRLNGFSKEVFLDYLTDKYDVIEHMASQNNSRMTQVINDATAPRNLSIVVSIVLLIVIGIVISTNIKEIINREKKNIFTLYAIGYSVKEIFIHYLRLPFFILSIGIVVGIGMGMVAIESIIYLNDDVYNYPQMVISDTVYLTVGLSIVMPMFIVLGIISQSLIKRLNARPLEFLHTQIKIKKSRLESKINITKFRFENCFRIRQMIRNTQVIYIFFFSALFVSILMVFSFSLKSSVDQYMETLDQETKYENFYMLDELTDFKFKNSERVVSTRLFIKDDKKNIIVQSIEEDSEYFNYTNLNNKEPKGDILVSNALANKYKYKPGDVINLYNELTSKEYTLQIDDIVDYNQSNIIFIKKKTFKKIFDYDSTYYNALVSKEIVDLGELKSTCTTKNEVIQSGEAILNVINTMVYILMVTSIVVCIIVLYLICKYNLEKNISYISLLKVLGYDKRSINRMYEKWNSWILIIAYIVALPIGLKVVEVFFQGIVGNLNNYIVTTIQWQYVLIGLAILSAGYLVSNFLIIRNIERIPEAQILKSCEE